MLPVFFTILLLSLELTCEGIEYHVKPTDSEVTQCPGQPCQTLAEYLENKTWDYTSHARVVIMPGHHRVAQLFLVRLAFNFTLLGSTRVNHTPQDTRPILHIARIWFDNIINLNLTGIIVIKSDGLEASPFAALKFTRIFTLQISQIAVHSPRGGIYMENVFGNSVIEHSSFGYGLTHISMHFIDCPLHVDKSRCAILQLLHVHLKSYHPNVSVQDCIFKSDMDGGESIRAILEMNSFPVQIVISNITALGEQQITLST